MNAAYVSKSKGTIHFHSEMFDQGDELPDDISGSGDYVEIPCRIDLDLGQRLEWRFVQREIPGLENKVRGFFSKRGAYSRDKDFLESMDLLEKWHEFEDEETIKALKEWCGENEIEIEE